MKSARLDIGQETHTAVYFPVQNAKIFRKRSPLMLCQCVRSSEVGACELKWLDASQISGQNIWKMWKCLDSKVHTVCSFFRLWLQRLALFSRNPDQDLSTFTFD